MKMTYRKKLILDTIESVVANFLYYGRKEDEELGIKEIENAVASGEITIDEIVDCFSSHLIKQLK